MAENTILSATYKLTSDVIANYSQRKKYQDILNDLRENKHFLFSATSSRVLQFAGLLIADNQLDKINENSAFKFEEHLTSIEKQELSEIFLDFHLLNLLCLEPILSNYPQLELPLIHYLEFNISIPEFEKTKNISFISKDKLDHFLPIFWTHPSFSIIQNNLTLLKDQSVGYIENSRRALGSLIESREIIEKPNFLRYEYLAEGTKEKRLLKFFFGIICLRTSIKLLNEILFMAILEDRLPKIDESNLLKFPHISQDGIGRRVELLCTINEKNIGLLFSDWLFFMDLKNVTNPNNSLLYFCEKKNFQFSQEFGDEITLFANNIDKNLNPYTNLIK